MLGQVLVRWLLLLEIGLEADLVQPVLRLLGGARAYLGRDRRCNLGYLVVQWLLLVTDLVLVRQLDVLDRHREQLLPRS